MKQVQDTPPLASKQAQKSTATRERIVQATISAMARKGYAAASLDKICEQAGITRGALQYHFGGRDGLMAACFEQMTSVVTSTIDQTANPALPLPELLEQLINTVFDAFLSDQYLAVLELSLGCRNQKQLTRKLTRTFDSVAKRSEKIWLHAFADTPLSEETCLTVRSLILSTARGCAITNARTGRKDRYLQERQLLKRVLMHA